MLLYLLQRYKKIRNPSLAQVADYSFMLFRIISPVPTYSGREKQ